MKEKNGLMRSAVREAAKNLKWMHGGPFGACLIKGGSILALSRNTVLKNQDPTCHAEMNAIRTAAKKLGTFDLSGCVIYSTTEPCPMCFSAIHWAKIDTVFYGTETKDAKRIGFNELNIPDRILKKIGKSKVKLVRSSLLKECRDLLSAWERLPRKKLY